MVWYMDILASIDCLPDFLGYEMALADSNGPMRFASGASSPGVAAAAAATSPPRLIPRAAPVHRAAAAATSPPRPRSTPPRQHFHIVEENIKWTGPIARKTVHFPFPKPLKPQLSVLPFSVVQWAARCFTSPA